jgi:hypothetical protein
LTVDERAIKRKPKEARARIPLLRPVRHRADLYEAEAERGKALSRHAVLIKACGETDGILKRDSETLKLAEGRTPEMLCRQFARCACAEREIQRLQCQFVSRFGLKPEKERAQDRAIEHQGLTARLSRTSAVKKSSEPKFSGTTSLSIS